MGLGTAASPLPLATPPSPASPARALCPTRPALCLHPVTQGHPARRIRRDHRPPAGHRQHVLDAGPAPGF